MEGLYRENLLDLVKYVHQQNILSDEVPSVEIIQIDLLKKRISDLISGFSSVGNTKFNFAFAVKASTFTKILHIFLEMGCGAECASYGEVLQSLHAGFEPSKIVFDSPCKTVYELERSLEQGICINCDNFSELERIQQIFIERPALLSTYKSSIGLRINPQLKAGQMITTSTATKTAHFGVPLIDNVDNIINVYRKYTWLTGIHLHMGSQGISIDLLLDGIKSIYDLAVEVNTKTSGKVKIIDIGGGLPVDFNKGNDLYPYRKYAEAIQTKIPNFFNGDFMIYTEFGNSVMTKCGATLTTVEYVKNCGDVNTIIGHIGVNYNILNLVKGGCQSEMILFNSNGEPKLDGPTKISYRIVGPLCFSGDIVRSDVLLPEAKSGDWLLILDTGSYCHAWYAIINAIPRPPTIGVYRENDVYKHIQIYKGETYEDTLKLWE